ncbi:MAG: potassium transporter TrkH [Sandaracinaceae bacterium]|nr:potassium transporter TrkH [Sandaracinaceae bacterium]
MSRASLRAAYADRHRITVAIRRERGRVLWVLGPAAASLGLGALPAEATGWRSITLLVAALLSVPAGAWLAPRPRLGRACAAAALLAGGVALSDVLLSSPAAAVGLGALVAALYLYAFVDPLADAQVQDAPGRDGAARVGLLVSAGACFAVVAEPRHLAALSGAALATIAATSLAIRWAWYRESSLGSRGSVGLVLLAGWITALTVLPDAAAAASLLGGGQLLASALVWGADPTRGTSPSSIFEHPARVLVATFAGLCAIGAVALALPACAEGGQSVGLLDAAFTAVSAVCVTGLIVLDTPAAFSGLGQGALLVLIQVGGLGIMTFYTVAIAALGARLSLRHERALAGAMNIEERGRLVASVRRIFLVTGLSELGGAALLAVSFARHGDGVGEAIWRGLFTSVSAFCNAGFALQSDSLIPYQTDPLVLHVVAALIVLGGLSPAAVVAIPRWVRGERVHVQASLILWTSLALTIGGAVTYGLMEWTETLGQLSWMDRVHNAWFQSITLRTAGFNSVDLAAARPATQTMMIIAMFIGGSPGGTAGGVKTTTAAVLMLTVAATLRGHDEAVAYGRRIARRSVYKAAAVVTVGVLVVFGALVAMELTQALTPEVAVFEVVSALATVGLSIGGTASLDAVGKVIVILCMFAGRVGPLTLFLFLAERHPTLDAIEYPEAEVDVG